MGEPCKDVVDEQLTATLVRYESQGFELVSVLGNENGSFYLSHVRLFFKRPVREAT